MERQKTLTKHLNTEEQRWKTPLILRLTTRLEQSGPHGIFNRIDTQISKTEYYACKQAQASSLQILYSQGGGTLLADLLWKFLELDDIRDRQMIDDQRDDIDK